MTDVLAARHRFASGTLLAAISHAVAAAAGDVTRGMRTVCGLVAEAFGDSVILRLGDTEDDLGVVGVGSRDHHAANEVLRAFESGPTPPFVREVFRTGRSLSVRVEDGHLGDDEAMLEFQRRSGYRGAVMVALRARGRVIGVLSLVCADEGHLHPDDDVRFLEEIVDRCALDLVNARLLDELTHELGERSLAERRHAALLRHATDVVVVVDRQAQVLDVTPAVRAVLGCAPEELLGTNVFGVVEAGDVERVQQAFTTALEVPGPSSPIELRIRQADGSVHWVEVVANNLLDDAAVSAVVLTARDVTERRLAGELIAVENKVLEQIAAVAPLDDILDGLCRLVESRIRGCVASVWVLDGPDRLVKRASPSIDMEPLLGGRELVLSADRIGLLGPEHPPVLVTEVETSPEWAGWKDVGRAAGIAAAWSRAVCEPSGAALGSIVLFFGETADPSPEQVQVLELATHLAGMALDRDRARRELAYAASHDALTGLPNRGRFLDRLGGVLGGARVTGEVAVLFIDLDDFKSVNDTAGHAVGDQLLRQAANRLAAVVRPGDLIARLGGDEFAVLCVGLGVSDAAQVAHRVLAALDAPFLLDGRTFHVSASAGIAVGDGTTTPDAVLRDADTAMYQAKREGRNRSAVFTPAVREATVRALALEQDLRRAIEASELTVHYQPVVSLRTGELIGLEALARWTSSTHGEVPPYEFITIAERAGLIGVLGACILRQAVERTAAWRASGLIGEDVTIAVNVAAQQLADPNFVPTVVDALQAVDLPFSALCIEVTESAVMTDIEGAQAMLGLLRSLGLTVAIDDFGTGHSSLARLRSLEASVLKLDRTFILDLDVDPESVEMVRSVVQLAHALGKRLVVEGVELPSQLRMLRELGADAAQGFHLARPQAAAALEGLLRVTPSWDVAG